MKKMTKIAALIMALLMVVTAFAGCTATDDELTGTLIVGTNPEFPPFEFYGDDGEVDGFDIAMMKLIAEELDMEFQLEIMEFKSLIAAIESGQIDCSAAGMTVTDERKQSVNFSDSYYTASQKVILNDGSTIATLADLEGKKIGVQEGTTGDFLCDDIAGCETIRFKKGVDAVLDLKNGNLDAVIIDSNPAAEFVKANEGIFIKEEIEFEPEYYAIAVSKDQPKLLEAINNAIKTLQENGKFDELIAKYI
jgi:ABC-type amino acid transport substrate-binding protein